MIIILLEDPWPVNKTQNSDTGVCVSFLNALTVLTASDFTVLCTVSRHPVPEAAKQLLSITELPACFTVVSNFHSDGDSHLNLKISNFYIEVLFLSQPFEQSF